MTLYQIQGLVNNASLANTKLLFMDGACSQIQQLQTQNVVNMLNNWNIPSIYILLLKTYQIYRDQGNQAFATLISNSDLNSLGINTNGSNFRVVSE